MNAKSSKKLFALLLVVCNAIFIVLAVLDEIKQRQEISRWNLWVKELRIKTQHWFTLHLLGPNKVLASGEASSELSVYVLMAFCFFCISFLLLLLFFLAGRDRKRTYRKDIELHEMIQNYLSERYDKASCPETDKWMHRMSGRGNIRFVVAVLSIGLASTIGVCLEKAWIYISVSLILIFWETFSSLHTKLSIVRKYDKDRKPVEALKCWYHVRYEDSLTAYYVRADDLNMAHFMNKDGAYEDAILLADMIWSKLKKSRKKGRCAIQYWYVKYCGMHGLELDTTECLQKLNAEIDKNPKDLFGKEVRNILSGMEQSEKVE